MIQYTDILGMNKIFLTSDGLEARAVSEAFLNVMEKPPQKLNALVVAHSKNAVEEQFLEESIKSLRGLGVHNVVSINLFKQDSPLELDSLDIIYMCGGNTFLILKYLRQTKLDQFIIENVKNGVMYVGVSAGSIIAGPSIEIAGYGSQGDTNDTEMTDLRGLGLIPFAIYPHFDQSLTQEVEVFRSTAPYEVLNLKDGEALLVNGDEVERIDSRS